MSDHSVLWLDNDPGNIAGLVMALRRSGMDVTVVRKVGAAETLVRREHFDLVLVDVMVPVTEEEITSGYAAEQTEDSLYTGLVFYIRNRQYLVDSVVVVLTVRIDGEIREKFVAAGLPVENFLTRFEVRDTRRFTAEIQRRLRTTSSSE
jgi:CheY-like chemotaxis protein